MNIESISKLVHTILNNCGPPFTATRVINSYLVISSTMAAGMWLINSTKRRRRDRVKGQMQQQMAQLKCIRNSKLYHHCIEIQLFIFHHYCVRQRYYTCTPGTFLEVS